METSVPDIYAAGDAVQVKHYVTGNDVLISLAGPANNRAESSLIIFVAVIVVILSLIHIFLWHFKTNGWCDSLSS